MKFDVCYESRAFMTDKLFSSENWMGNWSESVLHRLKAHLTVWEYILQMTMVPSVESIYLEEWA